VETDSKYFFNKCVCKNFMDRIFSLESYPPWVRPGEMLLRLIIIWKERVAMALLTVNNKKLKFKTTYNVAGILAACTAGAVGGLPGLAHASLLSPMQQYNLIVLGNYGGSGSDVQGTAFVAGNLSGTETFGTGLQNNSVTVLTVGGEITGASSGAIQADGNIILGGTNPTGVTANDSGTVSSGQSIDTAAVENAISQESTSWANAAPSGVTVTQPTSSVQYLNFAVNSTAATAVVDIASSVLNNLANCQVEFSGLTTGQQVVVNVDSSGTHGAVSLASSVQFDPIVNAGQTANILWNFYNATKISFSTEFYGSVLAPLATVGSSSPIDGSVAVGAFTSTSEVHLPLNTVPLNTVPAGGPLPIPASFGLVGIGSLGLLAGAGMRKRVRM
jgi:choice-of-anchor A domain-containing protein